MIPGIDPRVDYAFKKVFGSEANAPILLDFLNAVLNPAPDRRIVALTILNPFNDKDALDDKLSILDVKVRDQAGRHYNVEMEMCPSPAHRHRVLYYWAVLHSQQLREGDDYPALQPTISIAIVNRVLFPDVAEYHLDFQLRGSQHPQLLFSDQAAIHVLELSKFQRSAEELAEPLDAWCYFLTHATQLDMDQLPKALHTPPVQRAMEVLNMLSQNDLERERYEARVKLARDKRSREREYREGIEEARKTALNAGQFIGRIHVCQRLLKMPLAPADDLLLQSADNLEAMAKSLEQQLGIAEG